ncbi:hypothetical protein GGS20DRAFT_589302 [Poronia punctata]|nr:hypothetical protein GGS20DRAFT_589302 [Poronia punctata]
MDYICCCLGRRKSTNQSNTIVPINELPNTSFSQLEQGVAGEDIKGLTDLRQKCEDNTLSTAEARALLDASGTLNEPFTPREIEELHRLLSPPPNVEKERKRSSLDVLRPLRTPTNQMMPDAQEQSDLFCIPAEVRAQIWRYAIGGRKIYLAVKQGKLEQQEDMQCPYWRHTNGLLSIPLTCRKSYLESINFLYSENTFGLGIGSVGSSKDFFRQASTLLLPQCTAAITSLEVGFHLSGGYSQYYDNLHQVWDSSLEVAAPEPLSSWNSVFRALAQMKQLKSLVVVVWASGDRRQEFKAREPELMDIPMRMTGLKTFEVWLPWEEDRNATSGLHDDDRVKPYIVKRDYEDRDRFGVSVPNWKG